MSFRQMIGTKQRFMQSFAIKEGSDGHIQLLDTVIHPALRFYFIATSLLQPQGPSGLTIPVSKVGTSMEHVPEVGEGGEKGTSWPIDS